MRRASLNHAYRLVWSEVTLTWVAVAEFTRSRSKSGGRKLVVEAVAAAVIAMGASHAMAGTISTTTHVMGSSENLTVNSGDGIEVSGSGVYSVVVSSGTVAGSITNAGTISSVNADAVHVTGGSLSGGIHNQSTGVISGGSTGVFLGRASVSGGIVNQGSISGQSQGIGLYGSVLNGGITNSGALSMISGASSHGIGLHSSTLNGGVVNEGTITGQLNGIYLGGTTAGSTLTGGITNSGQIIGATQNGILLSGSSLSGGITNLAGGTISGNWNGIAIHTLNSASGGPSLYSTLTGGITNSGLIQGVYGSGIHVTNAGIDGSIVNNAGGVIAGLSNGIYLHSSTLNGSIVNAGTITVDGGEGGAAVKLSYSSLSGGITNSGSIVNTSSGAAVYVYSSGLNNGITNSGTASSIVGANTGVYVGYSTLGGAIVNQGTISGTRFGVGIFNSTVSGGITNSGSITATNASYYNGAGVFVGSGSTVTGGIVNTSTGVISGASGIMVRYGSTVDTIRNSGNIIGNGEDGISILNNSHVTNGILNDATGTISGVGVGIVVDYRSTISGGISNAGTIMGGWAGIGIIYDSTVEGGITNSGYISALGGAGISSYAGVLVASNSTVSGGIVNSSTGVISGSSGISLYNSMVDFISNQGTIVGNGQGCCTPGSGIGVWLSSVSGNIENLGAGSLISGQFAGIWLEGSAIAGSIVNQGAIVGQSKVGVSIDANSSISGGITNSGVIYGANYSVYVDSSSTVSGGVHNLSGGQLIGGLYLGGNTDLYNDGVITLKTGVDANDVRNSGTITSGYVGGNFTQSSTGVLRIGAASTASGDYGQLTVSGTARLAGTIDVDAKPVTGVAGSSTATYNLAIGNTLSGVIQAGTLVGNFNSVTDNSALFDFRSVVDSANPNWIDLVIVKGLTVTQSAQDNSNNPALGAAGVLDNLISGGGTVSPAMQNVINVLGGISSEKGLSDAASQTLPLLVAGANGAVREGMHGINRIIQSRQEGNHGLSSGDDFYGDKYFWFKPFGSWANQDDRKGVSGYGANTWGMIFGADAELSGTNRVGAAFAYSRSNIDGNSSVAPTSANVDNYQGIVYGSHSLNDTTDINYQLDIGRHDTSGNRDILFMGTTAHSDYKSWSAHVGAGIGHNITIDEKTTFTPSVRADYTWMRDDSYSETGAGALNLNVNANSAHELILAVDGKLRHNLTDNMALTANLGAGYDVLNEQNSITADFAGAPSAAFITKGMDMSPWLARGGLGLTSTTQNGVEISARYDFELRSGFDNQTASVKVRVPF